MKYIKICHILTANPYKEIGGTPVAASFIIKHEGEQQSIVKHGIGYGLFKTIIYPFLLAIRIAISDFDLVHIHDPQGYWYTFLPKFLKKKIIYTSHGETTEYYKVMRPVGTVEKIKAKMAVAIQKRLITQADVVVAVSEAVKASIIKYYDIKPEKVVVIYNGVDTKKFTSLKKKTKNIALWVGTNSEVKGLEKAIEYAKKHKMKLRIVGIDGKSREKMEFLGRVAYDRMPEIYNSANVLLYFSTNDGHPLVPLEAMACGLDVIASRESNIEIIPQEKDGTYKISGSKALKIVKNYDWSIQARKYIKLYKQTIVTSVCKCDNI